MATCSKSAIIILMQLWITNTICSSSSSMSLTALPKFRAILIFGDSTVDTGNNNYISTLFKGNHYPYGQDFPGHIPTGRFSNGKLVPDFVASFLGIKEMVPSFLDPKLPDEGICTGVSFASAGSGYDELTTKASKVIPVSKQIELFRHYVEKLEGIVGEDGAKKIIGGAFLIISAGTNDFSLNFYDIPTRRLEFNVSKYQDFLLHKLENFVKELYEMGCRIMVIAGLPPIGCIPLQMTAKFENPKDRECLEDQNLDSQAYNSKLEKMLTRIQLLLPRSKIIYADVYNPLIDMIDHPHKFGFVETKIGCCGTGLLEAAFLCNPTTPTCGKASQFVFWDSVHPSQAANEYLAQYLAQEILPKLLDDHSY